jgi:hypothetical protein
VSTRAPSSSRGIPVELPDRLGEPLVIRRRPWWRARLERPDGSELPTDRRGNRLAEAAHGLPVRVRPALGRGQFGHAVFIDDVLVPVDGPLGRAEAGWLWAAFVLIAGAGLSVIVAAYRFIPHAAPACSVAWLGLLVARYGLWVAARQLRRRGDPRRRTRAAVTTVSTVLIALGLYVALLLASLWL